MLRAELDTACDSGMLGCMQSTIAGLWAVLCKEVGKAASELGLGPSDLNLSAVKSKPRTAGRGSVQLSTCMPPPEPTTLLRAFSALCPSPRCTPRSHLMEGHPEAVPDHQTSS